MISQTRLHVRIVLSVALIVTTMGESNAQRIKVPLIDIDCSAYQRKDDGTWIVLHSSKVVLGSNVNKTVVLGDDPHNVQLTPASTLDSILNATCGKFKK
jgi:hypothetical protein